ncbi:MAG: hypothetical protein GX601_07555 [Anaerolineales bacterium]|nr:hypothetical protein [Anaerolineales bacterium]
MSAEGVDLAKTNHREWILVMSMGLFKHEKVLYFGNWESVAEDFGGCHRSNTQYNAFEFSFRGPTVQWIGSKASNHGVADVYIDGEFQQTVDNYSPELLTNVVKFEKTGLSDDRIHTLRVVVKKDRHPDATDCYQDVTSLQSITPVSYPAEIASAMTTEYAQIQNGTKPYLPPEAWAPVAYAANFPESGVELRPGVFLTLLNRNVDYLNHCFASPTFCDGLGWSSWLPASNHGRMLAGAANTLRWGERADMRRIVDTLIASIKNQMRDDGYYNYYPEDDSYTQTAGLNSERKNYDRVFWTRGLLAAAMVGNPDAHGLLRRMYDWFNASPYLPNMLLGGNATNGLPGGPLMVLSPAGKDSDLVVTERYYDQDYWMHELANREPLCLSHYPDERPHCYDLLGIEAFADEYRATGAQKYIDAVEGAWDIYRENYKHVGGATAICEADGPYPPKSYYITTGHTGELCGSVFWVNVNSRLLQLYPTEEKYAAEIEEALYNVVMAAQDSRGYIRYHARLHGNKQETGCQNTCCEVSGSGLIARLPEYVYSIAPDGLYVNLFAPSVIKWEQGGSAVKLTTTTDFPFSTGVSMEVSTATARRMNLRVRVPSWATGPMVIKVNDADFASGTPGSYVSLDRVWSEGDTIRFTLPIGFTTVKYTGLDQVEGNHDRYALLYGPVLMALQGDPGGPLGVARVAVAPDSLPDLLVPMEGSPLEFEVAGHPGYKYVPYWTIGAEPFTCFPIVEP